MVISSALVEFCVNRLRDYGVLKYAVLSLSSELAGDRVSGAVLDCNEKTLSLAVVMRRDCDWLLIGGAEADR